MQRSATTHSRPIEKRSRKRSTTGRSVVTSAVLPSHISVQIGRPSPSTTRPRIDLLEIGAKVLGVAVLAEGLAALAVEGEAMVSRNTAERSVKRSRSAVEQLLFDQVLDAARRDRPARLQFLAEPGHGAVEVMRLEPLGESTKRSRGPRHWPRI
jgi:hypothetical protein